MSKTFCERLISTASSATWNR